MQGTRSLSLHVATELAGSPLRGTERTGYHAGGAWRLLSGRNSRRPLPLWGDAPAYAQAIWTEDGVRCPDPLTTGSGN